MGQKLSPAVVAKATPAAGTDRTFIWDSTLPGFGLQVTATGHKSFVFQYRVEKKSRRMKLDGGFLRHEAKRQGIEAPIGRVSPLEAARREARAAQGAVAHGRDPLHEMRAAQDAETNTLKAVAQDYLARDGSRLRSKGERERIFKRYIYPELGSKPVAEIRRVDIVKLLDDTEDENGPVMADHVLAALRRLFNWHAARSDDFNSPIVRGMARTKPRERRRQRILTDDELRAVWRAAEALETPYGWFLRLILLTATRRNEAARMRRAEVSGDDWTIPGSRHKSKRDFLLPLSAEASTLLKSVPLIGRKDGFVFTHDGERPLGGFSKFKREFDKLCGVKAWKIHDLRRTARSLMSRAGVDPDHAERATGHVIPGIRGTYDLYEFRDEKRRALEALAAQIDRIVNPQPNVIALKGVT